MQISGYGAISQTQWPYEQQKRTRAATESSGQRGDTVSFSAEALEMLARSQAAKADAVKAGDSQTDSRAASDSSAEDSSDTSAAPAASSGATVKSTGGSAAAGGGFGETAGEQAENKANTVHQSNQTPATDEDSIEGIENKIKSLKGQIEQLTKQIGKIYEMPVEPRVKEEMAQPFQERIDQLQQEIQQLESKMQAMTKTSEGGAQG